MSTTGEPPHGAQTRVAMTVSGLMMAHQVAGKATRDAIFLSEFKVAALPTIMATAVIAAVVINPPSIVTLPRKRRAEGPSFEGRARRISQPARNSDTGE